MNTGHGSWIRISVITLAFLVMSGCSSKTYVRYSRSELELVPEIAFIRLLLPDASLFTVEVSASELDSPGFVKALADQQHVIVTDVQGRDLVLPFNEIDRLRYLSAREQPESSRDVSVGETAGYALIYGPMVPIAVAALPVLSAFGLNEGKNSADERKAALVYKGMSRNQLRTYIGEPKERYSCDGYAGYTEVWVFENDVVLRGGRALFIHLDSDMGNLRYDSVWDNSENTTFFRDSCSLIVGR